MYTYSVYDLTIDSEFELTELTTTNPDKNGTDIRINEADIQPVTNSIDSTEWRDISISGDVYRLTYDSVGTFLIKNGTQIEFDPAFESIKSKKKFRQVLLTKAMSLLLYQRGYFILHASAVCINDSAVLFFAPSGGGKSTTTAAFYKYGYSVLADDVVAIRFSEHTTEVLPGIPEIRINQDTACQLELDNATEPDSDWGVKKLYKPVTGERQPKKLSRCYVLEEDKQFSTNKITGNDALLTPLEFVYIAGLAKHVETEHRYFTQCSKIAQTADMYMLKRPKEYSYLTELINHIVDD